MDTMSEMVASKVAAVTSKALLDIRVIKDAIDRDIKGQDEIMTQYIGAPYSVTLTSGGSEEKYTIVLDRNERLYIAQGLKEILQKRLDTDTRLLKGSLVAIGVIDIDNSGQKSSNS